MNSIAMSVSRLRLTSRSGWVERPLQFISLAKPGVMVLSLFTAFVGLMRTDKPGATTWLHRNSGYCSRRRNRRRI